MLFFGNVEQKWLTKQCKDLGKKHFKRDKRKYREKRGRERK